MKKNVFVFFRNYWITIWLLAVLVSFASVFSQAAYTAATTTKRVISLSRRDSILFSSNRMSKSGTDMQSILFSYADGETPGTPNVVVDVCNYDANGNVYGSNFSFKLKVRLVKPNGDDISASEWSAISPSPTAYKVSYKSVTAGTLTDEYKNSLSTAELTLTNVDQYVAGGQEYQFHGSDKTRYLFETKYDVNDIINDSPAYGIRIEAELVGSYSDLENLSGKMKVIKGGATTQKTWEGKYMDVTTGRTPADYDAINYQISGNAVGTVSLRYRSDCVEIDKDSFAHLGNPSSTTTSETITVGSQTVTVYYKTLSISVDPETESMYDIKFYWKNGSVASLDFNDSFIKTTFS